LPHLLLIGIAVAVQKGKGKGGPRNEKDRGKGKGNGKGNGQGKGNVKGNSQTARSTKKPCSYYNANGNCRPGRNSKFSHEGARGANEVSAATVQSISDKITNRVMDSMKKGNRGQKKTQRRRDDLEEEYSDDEDEPNDNLIVNTPKTKAIRTGENQQAQYKQGGYS
jgi:hypothetical protein